MYHQEVQYSSGSQSLKKEVRKNVETSEKIWGYVAEEGEFENSGQGPLGPPKKTQNNF